MISKYDVKKYITEHPEDFPHVYNEEDDSIYDKDGKFLYTLDTLTETYRKLSGQSFTCLYGDDCSLENVLQCTECGTVIFSKDDESYDECLACPTCTGYKTYFKYWTKSEIEFDDEKQNTIKFFKDLMDERAAIDKRYHERGGKYDWQIAIKEFRGKKRYLQFTLECDDITKSYFKGLRLKVDIGKKDEDGYYVCTKHIDIPLSWSHFYIKCIYPHLGKCHPDFRSKWYIGKAVEKQATSNDQTR